MIRQSRLQTLLAHDDEPCVTLTLPTARAGPEVRQAPIRFKNLHSELEAKLQRGDVTAAERDSILRGLDEATGADGFWEHQREGLLLLAAPTIREVWQLPFALPESVHLGRRFQLLHALHAAASPDFELVCFSRGAVRVFRGDASQLAPIEVEGLPSNLQTFLRFDEKEKQLQAHSAGSGGGGRPPIERHGHGVGHDDRTDDLRRFAKDVAGALDGRRRSLAATPLVLAAPERDAAAYRAATDDPHLLDEGLAGNFDEAGPEELHASAWRVVERDWRARVVASGAEVLRAVAAGRGVRDAREVLAAAHEGRIRTLLVARDVSLDGRYDPSTRELSRGGDGLLEDLVDLAACTAATRGADVVIADTEEVSGLTAETPLAATLHELS